jgi:hypothetical protein
MRALERVLLELIGVVIDGFNSQPTIRGMRLSGALVTFS